MTTLLWAVSWIALVIIILFMFGAAKKRQGASAVREQELQGEIRTAQLAKKIEDDRRNDSRDSTINGL